MIEKQMEVFMSKGAWFGLALLCAGIGVGLYIARPYLVNELNELEALPKFTMTELTKAPAGKEFLINGTVSENNSTIKEDFVAYVELRKYEDTTYRKSDKNSVFKPKYKWRVHETVAPDILISAEAKDFKVKQGYDLQSSSMDESQIDSMTKYEGLKKGDPVGIRGKVENSSGGMVLVSAIKLARGTTESLLSGLSIGITIMGYGSYALMGLGGLFFLIFIVMLFVRKK